MDAPRPRLLAACIGSSVFALLTGCSALSVDLAAQRTENLTKDMAVLKTTGGGAVADRALTFQEVLEVALRNNLELRVTEHELEIASRERVAARLDMLPDLTGSAAATRRSDPEIKAVIGADGNPSGTSSISEPRSSQTADITLTWNVLDFMTAAIRSGQAEMQRAQLEYRRQKIRQRIAVDLIAAYWRAAAAEDALEYSYNVKRQMERQYERLTASMRDRSVSLLAGKEAQLKLIELSIAIQKLHGNLSTARLELVQLMGLKQSTEIRLQRPDIKAFIAMLPRPGDLDVKQLEFVALRNHPLLFESDLQTLMLQEDTRAAMLSLFPGASLFAGRNYDDNSLLRTNTWNAIGAELSWNLFALPAKFARLEAREAAEARGETERVLVTASVITQVHLGLLDYAIKADRFLLLDDSHKITQDIEGMTDMLRTAGQATDMQYTERLLENLATKLRRDEAVVELFTAYAKLFASVGAAPEAWQGNLAEVTKMLQESDSQANPGPETPDDSEGQSASVESGTGGTEDGLVATSFPVLEEPMVLASAAIGPSLPTAFPGPNVSPKKMQADDIVGEHLWDLQVGAFMHPDGPENVLAQIRSLYQRMLDSRDATVQPVVEGGVTMQRVRFHSLPKAEARSLCEELRSKGLECWVAPPDRG